MSYVFLDLEWNQGYPRGENDRLDEIIQIGAWRLENWQSEGEGFSSYVRPVVHKKMHHRVRKMLPLELDEIRHSDPFPKVIRRFFDWCGSDASFFAWGPSDAKVLDANLDWYGMHSFLTSRVYDLQRAYDVLIEQTTEQQAGLKEALDTLKIEESLEFHNAANDAYYTAQIAKEIIRRLGELPAVEALAEREYELIRQKRLHAAAQAQGKLEQIICRDEKLEERDCGFYSAEADCLKSRTARQFKCPFCKKELCIDNWYSLSDYRVGRCRCAEHGRYYAILSLLREDDRLRGICRFYGEDAFPTELFSQCKFGGEEMKLPPPAKKRKHSKRKK